jgi:hypothetical protein
MIAQDVYSYIKPAVELIMKELNGAPDASSLEERIHSRIWPYVTHAVKELNPSAIETQTPKRDSRTKSWKYVIRFWNVTAIGNNLIAESDEEIMQGTGALKQVIPQYAGELHENYIPTELSEDSIKSKLSQLRNNLGRQGSAVLRIPYAVGEENFLCNVDVVSLDA